MDETRFKPIADVVGLMRMATVISLAMIALLTGAEVPASQPAILTKIVGEWAIESSTGEEGAGHVFVAMVGRTVLISGDRISWVEKNGRDAKGKTNWDRVSRRLVPKPEISPLAIDLVADGPYQAWSRVAIMKVVDDELHLCVNFPQGPRPTVFEKGDDGRELVVFRRVKSLDRKSS